MLFRSDGTLPGRLSYRAFGQVRSQTGLINSPFRFNGYIDDGNGELSSPARYYATALGRFIGMDPAQMDPLNPITGNPYLGLNGNPMLIIDPTGKRGEGGHYYTSYYVGLRHGQENKVAQKFAFYSQLLDEVDGLDAIGVKAVSTWVDIGAATRLPVAGPLFSFLQPSVNAHASQVAKVNHSLTGRSGAVELQMTINALQLAGADIGTGGILTHRFADTDAHRVLPGYGREPDADAKTYNLWGFGHLLHFHTPDVIQTSPHNYLGNVRALSLWMSAQEGQSPEQANKLADEIVAELRPMAHMPTSEVRHEYSLIADLMSLDFFGLHQGGAIVANNHVLTEEELDKRSITMISDLIKTQKGFDLKYKPEDHGSELWKLALPFFGNVSLEEAIAQFKSDNLKGDISISTEEASLALTRAAELMNEEFKREDSKPAVVIEGRDGKSILKKQD